MREIKFRWFDVPANRMRLWEATKHQMCNASALFDYGDSKVAGFIPMQFTGLKDKNGREIYEGDIVDQWGNGGEPVVIEDLQQAHYMMTECTLSDSCIVIGNIYENPELLEVK
jgi:hypothetical protein